MPLTHGERETQTWRGPPSLMNGAGGNFGFVCVCVSVWEKERERGRGFLLETVNLISQHSSRNRKSNSVRAALSISCLTAQVDKCTAELIYFAHILDALMLFFFSFLLDVWEGEGLFPAVHMSGFLICGALINKTITSSKTWQKISVGKQRDVAQSLFPIYACSKPFIYYII